MNPDVYFERGRFIIKRAGTLAFQTGFYKKKNRGQELQVVSVSSFSESGFLSFFTSRSFRLVLLKRFFFLPITKHLI